MKESYDRSYGLGVGGAAAGANFPTPPAARTFPAMNSRFLDHIKVLENIVGRAREIADNLVGAEGEAKTEAALRACRAGQIGSFEDRLEHLNGGLTDLSYQLGRIEGVSS